MGSSCERFRRRLGFAFIAVRQEDKAAKAARAPHDRTTAKQVPLWLGHHSPAFTLET